jgi:hypothetical protein
MGRAWALRRAIAGAACVAVAVVFAGLLASAGGTRVRPQLVPKAVTLVISRFARADADAQVVAAPSTTRSAAGKYLRQLRSNPAALSISPSAAVTVRRLISRDEAAAWYTKRVDGFAWDFARVQLSRPVVLAQSEHKLIVTIQVTDLFHIQGQPRSWQGQNYSGTGNSYQFTFRRAASTAWQLTGLHLEGPAD